MLSWAITFLVIALIAAALGATGIAGTASNIAWILFVVFLVLFLVSLVAPRLRPPVALVRPTGDDQVDHVIGSAEQLLRRAFLLPSLSAST